MKILSAFLELLHLDGQKGGGEQKYHLFSFLFQTHLNSRTVNL